ncbi:MAG: succinate dehydrogenase cytochrome b subunit [Verrucomicrobia bacterium]|nr:succinate dehydrogenase cytochrome b subunit [Verrucomicrobiota bacterium]
MNLFSQLFRSTLGRKMLMALTGAALFLFAVGHMLGNLQVFLGPDSINRYAHFLHSSPELLWMARLGLLVALGVHVWAAVSLTSQNRAARPVAYDGNRAPTAASYASRTMFMSGLIVAAFLMYHLLHFTVRVQAVNFTGHDFDGLMDAQQRHDVHQMVKRGFSKPMVSLFYIVAVGLLCLHLSHGLRAAFQSLGFKNRAWSPVLDRLALVAGGALFAGYAAVPLGVMLGWVR